MGNYRTEIIDSMARTIFVCAWADREESEGRSYSGQDLFDVAPEDTPTEAFDLAYKWAHEVEETNGWPLDKLYADALVVIYAEGAKWYTTRKPSEERFGHCLAFEIMGHGVGWSDDYPDHGLKLPRHEGMLL
jgi:hypothetical protein